MFCPSCGARNPPTARSCGECNRPLPAARAPAAVTGLHDGKMAEPAMTRPDRPSAAPAEPPRILRRPAPLSPAPVDVVPKNPSPPPPPPPPPPQQPSSPHSEDEASVDPDGPTLIRRPSPRWSETFTDVTQPLPRMDTPVAVEGVATRAPAPRPVTVVAPPRAPTPRPVTVATPPRAATPAPAPVIRPPPLPPPTVPLIDLAALEGSADATGSTAAVPLPEQALPPAVLVLGGGWRLAIARGVDALLTAAIAFGLLVAALTALGVRAGVQPVVDYAHADPAMAAIALLGAPFCAIALYQALTVLLLRGTIGCRLVGLRVVRQSDGARPGVMRALVRGMAAAVGALLFGSGPLWGLLVDGRRRGLGDIVARSVIVHAPAEAARGSGA